MFAVKHSWTTSGMSKPLYENSYLQVMWWALANEKEENLHQMIIIDVGHSYCLKINV